MIDRRMANKVFKRPLEDRDYKPIKFEAKDRQMNLDKFLKIRE
jgi:hypothetical protein